MRSLTHYQRRRRRRVHRPHHHHHQCLPELCYNSLALLFVILLSFRNDSDNRSSRRCFGWCLVDCFPYQSSIALRHSTPRSSTSIRERNLDSGAIFMSTDDNENYDDGVQKKKQEYRRTPIGRITTLDRTKIDTSTDTTFYQNPNFVTHTDNGYIKSLQDVYRKFLPFSDTKNNNKINNTGNDKEDKDGLLVLDLMSSHVSHFPQDVLSRIRRVDVHGMDEEELLKNGARRSTNGNIYVRDLNANPSLVGLVDPLLVDYDKTKSSSSTTISGNEYIQQAYHLSYYDAVTCCVGIQYLQEPEAVYSDLIKSRTYRAYRPTDD